MSQRVPEKVIQCQIVALLRRIGARVYVLGTRRPRGDYPGTRQTAGLPDLVAFVRGELVMVECKAAGGRLRPAQEDFRQACLDTGVRHLVGGVDAVLGYLVARGLVRVESIAAYRQAAVSGEAAALGTAAASCGRVAVSPSSAVPKAAGSKK